MICCFTIFLSNQYGIYCPIIVDMPWQDVICNGLVTLAMEFWKLCQFLFPLNYLCSQWMQKIVHLSQMDHLGVKTASCVTDWEKCFYVKLRMVGKKETFWILVGGVHIDKIWPWKQESVQQLKGKGGIRCVAAWRIEKSQVKQILLCFL